MLIFEGGLNTDEIFSKWYYENKNSNFGAFVSFVGIVREEDGISGLSFDIYEPILKKWLNKWQEKAKSMNALVLFAHSRGDVLIHQTSYMAGILSRKRRVGLELIDEFVEDFKANAPIWKYDLKNGKRIYAKERSQAISGAGLLA